MGVGVGVSCWCCAFNLGWQGGQEKWSPEVPGGTRSPLPGRGRCVSSERSEASPPPTPPHPTAVFNSAPTTKAQGRDRGGGLGDQRHGVH